MSRKKINHTGIMMENFGCLICIILAIIISFCLLNIILTTTIMSCQSHDLHIDELHDGMWFLKESSNNEPYYCAGRLEKSEGVKTFFIPNSINGLPVQKLNYALMFNSAAGSIRENYDLKNLYIPGSIKDVSYTYYFIKTYGGLVGEAEREFLYDGIKIFYCGEMIDLNYVLRGADFYVPADKCEQFTDAYFDNGKVEGVGTISSANISYRLNAEEMIEYYYVDYVEYGEKIANIPPEPTREGYTFGGWYTEQDCINKWSFDNAVPRLAEGEDFNELCLYAKWTKK